VIGVPSEITQVEKRAVIDSARRAKASEVYLVQQGNLLTTVATCKTSDADLGRRPVLGDGAGFELRGAIVLPITCGVTCTKIRALVQTLARDEVCWSFPL